MSAAALVATTLALAATTLATATLAASFAACSDQPYFTANLVAYTLGLGLTVGVMHFFDSAQPALLYLVPACIGTSLATAAYRGEMGSLLNFSVEKQQEAKAGKSD